MCFGMGGVWGFRAMIAELVKETVWQNTHTHRHTHISAELLAPACYLFPSDLVFHCAPWESYKLRSQT